MVAKRERGREGCMLVLVDECRPRRGVDTLRGPQRLRVRARGVEPLDERVDDRLPVGRDHDALAPPVTHVLEAEGPEQRRQRIEPLEQRVGVASRVDEHEAAPGVDMDRRERPLRLGARVELVLTESERAGAVERVAEAVEPTTQLVDPAGTTDELHPAVSAGVVHGAQTAVGLSDHEDRLVADRVLVERAGANEVFLSARHLPGLGEQLLVLEPGEVAVDVAPLRHEALPERPTLGDDTGRGLIG